jgi:hypothetical protein
VSERGIFAVDRGIWDHPEFANEPFTEREAWQWLISEAAFKPRKKRVGNTVFDLVRGQLACSLRFMAKAWQWKKDKVARFLKRLETATMIATQARHDATVITICKYNNYQRLSLPSINETATPDATPTRHQRDKLENTKNIEIDDDGSKRAKLISDEAQETADAMAAVCGFPDPKNCPLGWYGAAAWVQKCFNEGWPAAVMVEATKTTAQRKRDGPIEHFKYLEKPLAKAIAEHLRPLPKIEIREAEKLTVMKHGTVQNRSGGSLIAAIDRELAAIEAAEGTDLALPENSIRLISC